MAQLAAIGIVTADIAVSTRFYRTLGVDVPEPAGDDPHVEATLPSGVRLMWDKEELIKQLYPEWERGSGGTAIALAFECGSPADVGDTYRRVVEAGFEGKKEPYDTFWGQRYANVVDPDGNVVDLFAAL
jgi:uncharacterized glyoxalase superfamily protein PhnB